MSFSGSRFSFFAAILAVALGIFTTTARADTYQLILVGGGNDNLYGIDRSGDLVVTYLGNCSGPFTSCYQEDTITGTALPPTSSPPALSYDNGTSCTSPLPTFFSGLGACKSNNGHEVFGGEYFNPGLATTLCAGPISGQAESIFCTNGGDLKGIFTGFNPFADWHHGSADGLVLNAAGDFGVLDGLDSEVFLGVDLTPEPNTLLLVGAGCISLFWIARRRVVHS
jgi:hypothetical protein